MACDHQIADRFKPATASKKDSTPREAYSPSPVVRKVQSRLNERLFKSPGRIDWPDFLFGSVPKHYSAAGSLETRDHIACVARHAGCRSALKLDIRDFFNNVHSDVVENLFFTGLGFSSDVSKALTKLCTHEDHLVQGAPSSSYIAMLCLHDVEGYVVADLLRKGLTYTRLVDDITVSSPRLAYDFGFAEMKIQAMLIEKNLPINDRKTEVLRASSAPIVLHGLRAGFKQPRLERGEVSRIRAAVRNLELLARESNYRTSFSYRKDFNRCMGRVHKLARVGHNQHQRLVARLAKIDPLPSKHDIRRTHALAERLEREFPCKGSSYWYYRRYHILLSRIKLVGKRFPLDAESALDLIRDCKPGYRPK